MKVQQETILFKTQIKFRQAGNSWKPFRERESIRNHRDFVKYFFGTLDGCCHGIFAETPAPAAKFPEVFSI